jgi:hypothetical protein
MTAPTRAARYLAEWGALIERTVHPDGCVDLAWWLASDRPIGYLDPIHDAHLADRLGARSISFTVSRRSWDRLSIGRLNLEPWRGRVPELDELVEWCRSDDGAGR